MTIELTPILIYKILGIGFGISIVMAIIELFSDGMISRREDKDLHPIAVFNNCLSTYVVFILIAATLLFPL